MEPTPSSSSPCSENNKTTEYNDLPSDVPYRDCGKKVLAKPKEEKNPWKTPKEVLLGNLN